MKRPDLTVHDAKEMERLITVCYGVPRGDELPQVAGVDDILMDVYSDILNIPREYATGRFHHQYDDGLYEDDIDLIH